MKTLEERVAHSPLMVHNVMSMGIKVNVAHFEADMEATDEEEEEIIREIKKTIRELTDKAKNSKSYSAHSFNGMVYLMWIYEGQYEKLPFYAKDWAESALKDCEKQLEKMVMEAVH